MRPKGTLILLSLALMLIVPNLAMARVVHNFDCSNCHKSGATVNEWGGQNICLDCHGVPPNPVTIVETGLGTTSSGTFVTGDASDRYGQANPLGNQTSHHWAGGTYNPAAGSKEPSRVTSPTLFGRYNITTGKVACARCHDVHADQTLNPTLLRRESTVSNAPMSADILCQACHTDFAGALAIPGTDAVLTHPLLDSAQLAAVQADPTKVDNYTDMVGTLLTYNSANRYDSSALLADGGVGCVSCHGAHFTDSDASTTDGPGIATAGDGLLLRGDGPSQSGATRNDTAQLRSNLCQACHTMELHGQTDQMLGCLDCHGGHSYNGGTPNAYILRDQSLEPLPTRINGVYNTGFATINFGSYPAGGSTRDKWADDNEGTADGLCEQCHGDVNGGALKGMAAEHEAGNTNECTACHKHNDPANIYSFNRDASAATCGQCHGFPPFKNVPGDRVAVPANDGGYAENNSADQGTPYDYLNDSGHFKDETSTGHMVHAGADLPTPPAYDTGINPELQWYFVGTAGVDNCKVCHGPQAGATEGGHRIDPVTDPATFRDVFFDGIAKSGGLSPSYDWATTYTCTNVYCHTNGAPYNGASRPNRDYTGTHATPPWVGNGSSYAAGGYGSIFLQADRCAKCHGNDVATMSSQSNTSAHAAHLGGATTLNMGITFDCVVCHVETATDADTLVAGSMDGRTGGKHINGLIDVDFQTGAVPNTLPEALSSSTYTSADGSCSTYCHNVTGDAGAFAADWDIATDMQCDSCHGGLDSDSSGDGGYGPITTGSHARHIELGSNGPELSCDECHGTDSMLGTHASHIDGVIDVLPPVDDITFADICQECHGYDSEDGEVLPVWGNSSTTDCATCHAGDLCGSSFNSMSPLHVRWSRQGGHNRPTSSSAYPQSGNPAANAACTDCHLADSPNHWDGTSYATSGLEADLLLRTDIGYPGTYAGNEDDFCANCHGAAGVRNHPTHAGTQINTQDVNTHQGKKCVACHNVHGDENVQMVWRDSTDQQSHDPSATGKYAGSLVWFTNLTDFGIDSYDEDDGSDGGVSEDNADDICAVCHTSAAGTSHNNVNNTDSKAPTGHYMGQDCFTCHATHTDATDAFKVGVGTACNDCHGFPPATGAHVRHSQSGSPDKDIEDISDCAYCHTGADAYTYDLTADIGNLLNHSDGTGRKSILAVSVGYNTTNLDCATACHTSTVANGGRWTDTTGLDCDACHSVASGGNLSASHDEHLDAGKLCTDCHTLDDGATPVAGPLNHIDDTSGGDEGLMYEGMAIALADEATVTRTSMTFDDPNNTCSGSGVAAGCHATGTPDWDVAIPADSSGCVECHTDTDNASFNPTSGLHDNNPSGPTVTGNAHDGSFDDGNAGTADCVTCHTTTPSGSHIDGNLDTGAAVTVAAIAGYTQANGTCATTCHSAGTTWAYKWATSAYNSDGTECANCHGDYANGWVAGVAPHTENPTRGSKHNNTGTLTYPCTDCHAIGSASGYNWTSKWDPTGVTSNHGDDLLTMNQTAINTFAIDTVPNPDRAGCTTTSCHGNDSLHNFTVTTTSFSTATVTGNEPSVLCSSCHGGYSPGGTDALGYWPDGTLDEDTAGAHPKHLEVLALEVYGETLTQLLTDNTAGNPALTSDEKQKELCSYCHNTPGSDGDHGIVANLPAEVNSMFGMWTKAADDGVYDNGADTCATVDCHFNKTTPDNTYGWYDGNTSACVMCHVDVTAETVHTAHTGASATFGRAISCSDCHDSATNWGTNTPPASGHLDNTYEVAGGSVIDGTVVTYDMGVTNSCGTNECHEDGRGNAPKTDPYDWKGGPLGDCVICHDASPTTSTHSVHNASSYVGSCDDCHTTAGNAVHIDNSVNYNTAVITGSAGSTPNVTCTNTCHGGASAEFDGAPTIICTDCHSGTYVGGDNTGTGGNNYLPQYNMHVVNPTVSGEVHDENVTGAGGDCAFCHDGLPAPGGTHVDGNWVADSGSNTDRGMFAGFSDGTPATCTTSCHSAGTSWTYKWSATAANNDGSECANCHGDYASGWNSGVGHATNPTRGNSSTHNDTGNLTYECTACHVLGATTNNYPWTTGSNDWASEGTTLHGDGVIQINSNGTTPSRHESPVGTWKSGCAACHDGASNDGIGADDGTHDFPVNLTAPSTPRWTYATVAGDAASSGGGCDACHGSGGYFAPDGTRNGGTAYPDRPGLHLEHITAMGAKGILQSDACGYCHPDPGGSNHSNNDAPLDQVDMPDNASWYYKRIIGGGNDANGVFSASTNSCSNIDCHFNNAVTPHWYTDADAPEAVTLTAVPGSSPGSIKVSWTAPGDDAGLDDTTAYVYDLRMGESQAEAENYGLTTNHAGGLPATYRRGEPAEVILTCLDPAKTYWFSLKTRDTAGNWSPASTNTPSATPSADNEPPMFYGADKATPGDEGGSINLWWTPAEDHSMYNFTTLAQTPISYDIWLKSELDGNLDMDVDSPIITGFTGIGIELEGTYGATTVTNDITYQLGVRACDALANCDTNTTIVKATPKAVPLVEKTFHTYVSSGTTTLSRDGASGGTATVTNFSAASPLVFRGASQAYQVQYFVDGFTIWLDPGNSPPTVTAELGIWNGSSFNGSGKTKSIIPGKRASKTYTFKFSDMSGVIVPAGQSIGIRLTATAALDAQYGTPATRGDASLSERIVNANPNAVQSPSVVLNGAIVDMSWTVPLGDTDGLDNATEDPIHYDIYGSNNNGDPWDYVIAEELDGSATSISWDTQAHGITSGTIAVKIRVGDGYGHTETVFSNLGTADSVDYVAPAAITDLVALARPKSGSVVLRWTSPGDDYWNNGRAHHFDIRWSTSDIDSDAAYNSANLVTGEPCPDFGKHMQEYEVTGLPAHDPAAPVTYYFAIKTVDEWGRTSGLSNSASSYSGPRCGMCHTTAPSVVSSVGNHKLHGYTLQDCAKCHGAAASTYDLDHQDGILTMGYGPGGPVEGVISTTEVTDDTITYTDPVTSQVMYVDTNGYGGFGQWGVNGDKVYNVVGDGEDNGSCFSFGAMGVGGCHGPAGSDPDGGGTQYPPFDTPDWMSTANLDCGRCHGNPNRDESVGAGYLKDPYGRDYDGTLANSNVVPDQIIGSPGADNRGGWDPADASVDKRKYIGQHEKHLNYSFRFSKGDSCNLCHAGHYSDIDDLDARHGDGTIDVELDVNAAGADAHYVAGAPGVAGTCYNMDPGSCHPYDATPTWDSQDTFDCIGCHTMAGNINKIGHFTDPNGGITDNADATNTLDGGPMLGNCTWCHFAGHPRDDVGGTALILPNNSQVGINYRSGGIHLRKDPGNLGRAGTPYTTQAELCWGCHDANGISEWETDDGSNNTSTEPANGSNYNYGSLTTSNWTTAQWSSPNFGYKTGNIQSTHSTNIMSGSSAVTWNAADGQYEESPDAVGILQCHNCHDVHNMNFAIGDTMNGNPYLRGTWVRNPYPEDGAPLSTSTYAAENRFMAVPRGGTQYNNLGGFQIDQNNIDATSGLPPTAGLGLGNSAGLCTLCHGTDVDNMDYTTDTGGLWIGSNGHSNSALGGTADDAKVADILSFAQRNPSETPTMYTADYSNGGNPMMGYVNVDYIEGSTGERGDGFRSAYSGKGYGITPLVSGSYYAYIDFNWGMTQDTGTVDKGYHAFTCSKCHNPHASRLPKLMITNCLDTRHNTWDNGKTVTGNASQGDVTSADNLNRTLSNVGSAQNCHRLGDATQSGTGGGWNKVTPWTAAP